MKLKLIEISLLILLLNFSEILCKKHDKVVLDYSNPKIDYVSDLKEKLSGLLKRVESKLGPNGVEEAAFKIIPPSMPESNINTIFTKLIEKIIAEVAPTLNYNMSFGQNFKLNADGHVMKLLAYKLKLSKKEKLKNKLHNAIPEVEKDKIMNKFMENSLDGLKKDSSGGYSKISNTTDEFAPKMMEDLRKLLQDKQRERLNKYAAKPVFNNQYNADPQLDMNFRKLEEENNVANDENNDEPLERSKSPLNHNLFARATKTEDPNGTIIIEKTIYPVQNSKNDRLNNQEFKTNTNDPNKRIEVQRIILPSDEYFVEVTTEKTSPLEDRNSMETRPTTKGRKRKSLLKRIPLLPSGLLSRETKKESMEEDELPSERSKSPLDHNLMETKLYKKHPKRLIEKPEIIIEPKYPKKGPRTHSEIAHLDSDPEDTIEEDDTLPEQNSEDLSEETDQDEDKSNSSTYDSAGDKANVVTFYPFLGPIPIDNIKKPMIAALKAAIARKELMQHDANSLWFQFKLKRKTMGNTEMDQIVQDIYSDFKDIEPESHIFPPHFSSSENDIIINVHADFPPVTEMNLPKMLERFQNVDRCIEIESDKDDLSSKIEENLEYQRFMTRLEKSNNNIMVEMCFRMNKMKVNKKTISFLVLKIKQLLNNSDGVKVLNANWDNSGKKWSNVDLKISMKDTKKKSDRSTEWDITF